MLTSHTWTEWHLTPRGWESETAGGNSSRSPADRVLTCQYLERRPDFFGGVCRSLKTTWHCDDPDLIHELMLRFGQFPPALRAAEASR